MLTVKEYECPDSKAARLWTQVGVAFPHKEGEGFNIKLRCVPLNGRLVILPPDAEDGTGRCSWQRPGALAPLAFAMARSPDPQSAATNLADVRGTAHAVERAPYQAYPIVPVTQRGLAYTDVPKFRNARSNEYVR